MSWIRGQSLICLVISLTSTYAQYYQFGYQVDTLETGDYHGHMEQLDGFTKRGEFKVRLPDGRLQVTSYQADEKGFRPKISYEIDPLFVPEAVPVGFTPEKKFVKRPPPRDYTTPELNYLPPSINYDPRGKGNTYHAPPEPLPKPQPSKPHMNYLPPQPPKPAKSYVVPQYEYNPYEKVAPLINYKPREMIGNTYGNHINPEMYTPYATDRQDNDSELPNITSEPLNANQDQQRHYYLVPIQAQTGSKPVLALLVKKRD